MSELLRVGQCSREFQKRTRSSAVELLEGTIVPSEPICAIVPRKETEKRVNRIVTELENAGLAGTPGVADAPLKEVVRIQLGLARVCYQRCEDITLRSALTLVLMSVSHGSHHLLTTHPLVQQMFSEIGLEDDELDVPVGKNISEIARNWTQEPVNDCTVGNLILVLRCLCNLRGALRRITRWQGRGDILEMTSNREYRA